MPSIANGANATGTLGTQDSVSIDAGGGFARFECPTGTIVAEFRGSRTFGPYDSQSFRVTSLQGAVYYEVADGSRIVPAYVDSSTGSLYSDPRGQSPVSGPGNFDATDTGTDWLAAPSVLSYTATLTAGTSTTVLIEVRNPALTVSTAQTIVADTLTEVLRSSVLLSGASQFRVRRSSGTGTVSFLIQG